MLKPADSIFRIMQQIFTT